MSRGCSCRWTASLPEVTRYPSRGRAGRGRMARLQAHHRYAVKRRRLDWDFLQFATSPPIGEAFLANAHGPPHGDNCKDRLRPRHPDGVRPRHRRRALIARLGRVPGLIAIAVVLSIGFAAALAFNVVQLRDSFGWVEHTNEVLREINGVARNILEAESNERGYLLTGEASYRDGYAASSAALLGTLDTLTTLMADNAEQARRLADLRPLIAARIGEFERALALGPAKLSE